MLSHSTLEIATGDCLADYTIVMGIKSHGAWSQIDVEHLGQDQQVGQIVLDTVLVARIDTGDDLDLWCWNRRFGGNGTTAGATRAAICDSGLKLYRGFYECCYGFLLVKVASRRGEF
jgi:hypothetical protein